MKILLTGAAGFIGFHTARALLKKKIQVIGIDNLNDYYSKDLKLLRLKKSMRPTILKKKEEFFILI